MKRILSLILAVLLAASALVACEPAPAETDAAETNAPATDAAETNVPATDAAETNAPETDAPATTTAMITENGEAKAHIVVAEGADSLLNYAAEELAYHIKLVSGAEVATVTAATADGMPIVIGTPDTNPELEELFADDLAWLRDLGDGDKVRWGSDGFSIRQLDGTLYIFGATPRGALNGVYDFIEDNMGVLWVRADESYGTIYDEMPTISLTAVDYREKSPFELRGWSLSGMSDESWVQLSRNKLNVLQAGAGQSAEYYTSYHNVGIKPFIGSHNITWWITESPSYDPDYQGYWATPVDSTISETYRQINFWNDVTAQCVADHVIAYLDENKEAMGIQYLGINLEDWVSSMTFEEMAEPYEYAPGEFIDPGATNYFSTVFFSFMNKIAAQVGEKYPDVILHSFAYGSFNSSSYWTTVKTPECELEDNLYVTFAPVDEDLCASLGESQNYDANLSYEYLLSWMEKTSHIQVYNYYGCYTGFFFYERPIWDRIQSDLQLYAANGLNGLVPEGAADVEGIEYMMRPNYKLSSESRTPCLYSINNWETNAMTYWIYAKLAWNPNEDVDALIQYYCDKVYGEAADEMLEYYRLMELSWAAGNDNLHDEFNKWYIWRTLPEEYWLYFIDIEVDDITIADALTEALNKAYDAAQTEAQKAAIRYRMEIYNNIEELLTEPFAPAE